MGLSFTLPNRWGVPAQEGQGGEGYGLKNLHDPLIRGDHQQIEKPMLIPGRQCLG